MATAKKPAADKPAAEVEVELTQGRGGVGFNHNKGDRIMVPVKTAERMIEAGQCFLVKESAGDAQETTGSGDAQETTGS